MITASLEMPASLGRCPRNRTSCWTIIEQVIEQDYLDVVISDTTRYEALREALSDCSLQELPMLEWAGGEESRATYISPQPALRPCSNDMVQESLNISTHRLM